MLSTSSAMRYAVSWNHPSLPILHDVRSFNQLAVLLLVSSTIVFAVVGIGGLARLLRRRRRTRERQESSTAAAEFIGLTAAEEESASNKQKEVARYNNIENWIVSKRIQPHDYLCAKCIGLPSVSRNLSDCCVVVVERNKDDPDDVVVNRQRCTTEPLLDLDEEDDAEDNNSSSNESSSSDEEQHHHHGAVGGVKECSICFEKLRVNEIVSWSPHHPDCPHVFHHACIKEWLLHNSGCPTCRATFLPIDMPASKKNKKYSSVRQIAELVHAQQQRSRHCYYCVQHGVVYLPCNRILKSRFLPYGSCSDELDRIVMRGQQAPTKQELFETRGGGGGGREHEDMVHINDNADGEDDDDDVVHEDLDMVSPSTCGGGVDGTTIDCSTANMMTLGAPTGFVITTSTARDDGHHHARSDIESASPTLVGRSFSI
jgi:Ring finger domain